MIRTCPDAGVLIEAFRGQDEIALRAIEVLGDPDREFVASIFLRMETHSKATFNKHTEESEFYEEFFRCVVELADVSQELVEAADRECVESGLNAMDSLHIAAAHSLGAVEFVTREKPARSIHRARLVKVLDIHSAGQN